jgi:penicillin-binding protein 1C
MIARLSLCLLGAATLALAVYLAWEPLPSVLSEGRGERTIADARGALLRESADDRGQRARWTKLDEVPRSARIALVESEDQHLTWHIGVDPIGIARAALLNLRARAVVAGGSTLAMQLARLAYDLPRSWPGKLEQLLRATVLQLRLGPDGVLEGYLNLAPFGRDVRGIAQASHAYFGKPLRDLTRGEAVLLACLPRGPSHYDPYRQRARLLARRAQVLGLLQRRGLISRVELSEIAGEPIALVPFERSFRAPHAVELAERELHARGARQASQLTTTIDPNLQRAAQWACKRAAHSLSKQAVTDCAAVIMRVSTAEVLAIVGSPDYFGAAAGSVNAALAPRQPGSALKPFVYALAFEQGKRPASRIVDEPTVFAAQFGSWFPANYDGRFHGEISLRQALACSYNVPAAKLTAELGPAHVLARLRRLGLSTLTREVEHYGVGLSLGVGEVTLLELVAAYATLARGGEYLEPTVIAAASERGRALALGPRRKERVFSREVSYLVSHVLADRDARRPAFGANSVLELPFDASVKTGTSSSYRDNWTLGYAGDIAVGVWVGRHDGAPMHGVSGVAGAGPAFRHLMLTAVGEVVPRFPEPPPGVRRAQDESTEDLTLTSARL